MRTRLHARPLERGAVALGRAAEHGKLWSALALAAAALDMRRREAWLRLAPLPPAAIGANYLVKLMVRRRRPELPDLPPLTPVVSRLSFPSAHATSSVAAATAFGRLAPGVRGPLRALATAVCLGRPYLGVHYPSDVAAGVLLGLVLGRAWPAGTSDG